MKWDQLKDDQRKEIQWKEDHWEEIQWKENQQKDNQFDTFEYVKEDKQSAPQTPILLDGESDTDMLSIAQNITENIASVYNNSLQVERDVAVVKAWSEVKLAEVAAKYKLCESFLNQTFGERDKALSKHYDLLDKALETNNKDAIILAMQGISSIVTSSPLADLEKFAQLYNDTSAPLLDF